MQSNVIENSSGDKLDVTFHPGAKRDYLIVLGHGLTGNKDRPLLVALAEGLTARGWPCMRISFSGNGNSGGRFEDATITKEVGDLQSVLAAVPDWVRVIYAGHSMGSAVGVLTAAVDLRIRALISLAGMSKPAEFYQREFASLVPGKDCMWDELDCPLSQAFADDLNDIGSVLPAAASVTQPWLLIHGSADDLVPVQDGEDAYSVASCRKQWLEIAGAGHSFDETFYPRMIDVIDGWLRAHFD